MTLEKAASLQVGQKLWYVPESYMHRVSEKPHEVTVTKVGRKWAEVSDGSPWRTDRINVDTLYVDGGRYTSPGRCYPSREEYEAQQAVSNAWEHLTRAVFRLYRAPDGVTIEDIREVARLLHIESET